VAKLPEQVTTVTRIYEALERNERKTQLTAESRDHLGASEIGKPCSRALWYGFRKALPKPEHEGRVLRLFRRGHNEEPMLIQDLIDSGVDAHAVDEKTGQQFRFSILGGHVAGSMDGWAVGLVEAPETPHVIECKTHKLSLFRALKKHGTEKANPEHVVQSQLYMKWSGMKRTLYLGVCKDDDHIYMERIRYNAASAKVAEDKAKMIVEAPEPTEKLSDKPEFYICKMCDYAPLCHQGVLPEVHCRTCAHSSPITEGEGQRWNCSRHNSTIPNEYLASGCDEHVYIPGLMPWPVLDGNKIENWVEYDAPEIGRIRNGSRADTVYTSKEIKASYKYGKKILDKPLINEIREKFDGEITE